MDPEGGACRGLSDEVLSARALEGSDEAWSELARRHTHHVLVALVARGYPLDVAEDAAQEAWFRLVRQQRTGRLREVRMPGLVIAQANWIAREVARTRARRAGIAGTAESLEADTSATEVPDPAVDVERQVIDRERVEAVRRELLRLPPRAQRVFDAAYAAERRTAADVAADLGLSTQRVRQILHEVRARMREVLAAMDGEGEP